MTAASERATGRPGMRRHVVARADEIPEGGRLLVDIDGRSVGIFKIDGEFYALLNRCPHRSGALCEGELIRLVSAPKVGEIELTGQVMLSCPWHAWEFDVKTGQSYWDPSLTRGRRYGVEVQPGNVVSREVAERPSEWVPGPYVASVIPTDVEDDYVVVTMRAQPPTGRPDAAPQAHRG